jgi:UDP-N-acetylmuramoylalanine--D-glutamate ligase
VAVITNIMADHLDRYASFAEYAEVKRSLVAQQDAADIAVLNANDACVVAAARKTKAVVHWFGKRRARPAELQRSGGTCGCTVANGWITYRNGKKTARIMRVRDVSIPGDHNLQNVLAAITAARAVGVSPAAIRVAVRAFRGVPHRLESVRTIRGVRYVNDSAATTPDATIAAIRAFDQPIVLICGGRNKGLDYGVLVRALRNPHVRRVILLEHPAYTASVAMRSVAPRTVVQKIRSTENMRDAVRIAAKTAERGDIVLLSPGAASFGMFTNEFDRGDQFRTEVRAL